MTIAGVDWRVWIAERFRCRWALFTTPQQDGEPSPGQPNASSVSLSYGGKKPAFVYNGEIRKLRVDITIFMVYLNIQCIESTSFA